MFAHLPNLKAEFGLTAGRFTLGTRGDDTITLTEPGVVFTGAGNDAVEGSSGNDIIALGAGDNTVTGGDGLDLVIAPRSDTITVVGSDGFDLIVIGNDTQARSIVEGSLTEDPTKPAILVWSIQGDDATAGTPFVNTWKINSLDAKGNDTPRTVDLQEVLDTASFTALGPVGGAQTGYVLRLGDDAVVTVLGDSTTPSLDRLIAAGGLELELAAENGMVVLGSEARDIIVIDETVEDAFVFVNDTPVPPEYTPRTDRLVVSSYSTGGTGERSDVIDLSDFGFATVEEALDNQTRTETGAILTLGDTTLTFEAGEAIVLTADMFII